jgi:hypothetical protein
MTLSAEARGAARGQGRDARGRVPEHVFVRVAQRIAISMQRAAGACDVIAVRRPGSQDSDS